MEFVGTGLRATPAGYDRASRIVGCDVAALQAVVEVEASGRGFDPKNRLKALFEPHKFYYHLGAGLNRDKAVLKGLAYPRWRPGNYPHDADGVYAQIAKACEIDETAALKATSWGLGQIMGENYGVLGHPSVQDFVTSQLTGEDAQLEALVLLIQHKGLAAELARYDWAGFARGWNGAGYAANEYDKKLQAAYVVLGGAGHMAHSDDHCDDPSMGDSGQVVVQVQKKLNLCGFRAKADGDFGPETKQQVRLLQLDHGLTPTGVVDAKTDDVMSQCATTPQPSTPRSEATPADLNGVSRIVTHANLIKKVSTWIAGLLSAVGISQQAGVVGSLTAVTNTAQQAQGAATAVGGLAQTLHPVFLLVLHFWYIGAVAALIWLAYSAEQIVKARLEDHRSGKTL